MKRSDALAEIRGLSKPSKMPCFGYSLPASRCQVGGRLQAVAGSTCSGCYALKGFYGFPAVQTVLERRYRRVQRALANQVSRAKFVAAFKQLLANEDYFRWHDSGDLISVDHLALIAEIAHACPQTQFWLPTREYKIVDDYTGEIPANLVIRLSAHMVDKPAPSVGLPTSTVHTVTPIGTECEAYTRNNYCGNCRACWDPDVANVSYRKH